jgi:hypothetical protein
MILRPHPQFKGYNLLQTIQDKFPEVVIQHTGRNWSTVPFQDDESVTEWANTVRHADVVVNLASTIAVDAAILDRPVVNIDYDPEPGQPKAKLVRAVNHEWNHYRPLLESGGIWNCGSVEETIAACAAYISNPDLHREGRARVVRHVAGYSDGRCGARMADALLAVLGIGSEQAV